MKNKLIKILCPFLALTVCLSVFSLIAFGDDINYNYDENTATLTVFGSGDISDFADEYSQPWQAYKNKAETLVISDGITSIGAYSFAGFSALNLAKIADSVKSVNAFAFASCKNLNNLSFSNNITSIADSSFAYNGTVPKADFKLSCPLGSFALFYAIKNDVPFSSEKVMCNTYNVNINSKGMYAYFPYTPACSGTFKFYSSGNEDTYGAIFDSSLNRLKYNDDLSSSNYNFSLTCSLEKGKTYYLTAKMASNFTFGKFTVTLEPVSFSTTVKLVAMADSSGAPSDMPVSGVTLDGQSVPSTFTLDLTFGELTKTFVYSPKQSVSFTFSPDEEIALVPFVTVDANFDGFVNAKDFAILKKSNSPYLSLYQNFINYKIN